MKKFMQMITVLIQDEEIKEIYKDDSSQKPMLHLEWMHPHYMKSNLKKRREDQHIYIWKRKL